MINTSETTEAIQAALAEFHKELPEVTKDSENPHFHSRFASLAANIKAADKKAAEHGLTIVQLLTYVDSQHGLYDALATRICHSSGEWMEAVQIMHLPKEDPQGQGSAMTYGRRYNYQGAYGLAAEDDDAEGASAAIQQSGSAASDRTPTSRGARSSGRAPGNSAGLIRKIATDIGMTSGALAEFSMATIGHELTSLDDLDPTEGAVVLQAIRDKEREHKAGGGS